MVWYLKIMIRLDLYTIIFFVSINFAAVFVLEVYLAK